MVLSLPFLHYQVIINNQKKKNQLHETMGFIPSLFSYHHNVFLIFKRPNRFCCLYCNLMGDFQKCRISLNITQLCLTLATPWTVAHQAPLSMGFSRQEYWSGVPLPSPKSIATLAQFEKEVIPKSTGAGCSCFNPPHLPHLIRNEKYSAHSFKITLKTVFFFHFSMEMSYA